MSLFSSFTSAPLRRAALSFGSAVILLPATGLLALGQETPSTTHGASASPTPAPTDRAAGEEPSTAVEAPAEPGYLVFIDPETGAISEPTPEQEAQMRDRLSSPKAASYLNKSSDGLVPFALDDGGRGVNLQDRFRHALRAQVQADGSLVFHCSDHPDAEVGHEHLLQTGPDADSLAAESSNTDPATVHSAPEL